VSALIFRLSSCFCLRSFPLGTSALNRPALSAHGTSAGFSIPALTSAAGCQRQRHTQSQHHTDCFSLHILFPFLLYVPGLTGVFLSKNHRRSGRQTPDLPRSRPLLP